MELRQYLFVLLKWWWMIVLATGLAAGLSYIATSRLPKIYQTSSKLIVGTTIQNVNPNPQDLQTSQDLARTYIQIAKTSSVLQATIDALGLNISSESLASRINPVLIPGTQIIELRVDDINPERAQQLANELAHQLSLRGPAANQDPGQREFIQSQVNEYQRKIQDAQKTIQEEQGSIEATLSARDIAVKRQNIAALEAQITQWNQTYATLLGFLSPRSPNYLSIFEPAPLHSTPYAPNVPLNVALAAALGLILSVGAAVFIEYLSATLDSPEEVTKLLGLVTLSTLANIKTAKDDETQKLVTIHAGHTGAAEGYRAIRTHIQLITLDEPIKSLLVTSGLMNEGKSLTAANLAVTMAQAGVPTILVDYDLRKPSLHRLFRLPNESGLTNALLGDADLERLLCATSVENLRIMTTGPLPSNPSELLTSQRIRKLRKGLENSSEIVIFDGPPCLPVADSLLLANQVGGVIFVIDVTRTRRQEALRAMDLLLKSHAHLLGAVLNRVTPRQSNYYYYYDYSPGEGRARKKKSITVTSVMQPQLRPKRETQTQPQRSPESINSGLARMINAIIRRGTSSC